MRVGDFELSIKGSDGRVHTGEGSGYIVLRHGEQYTLVFTNHTNGATNLYVMVDGLSVGDFQIGAHDNGVELERPSGAQQRFTFFAAGTSEAAQSGEATVEQSDKGVVSVRFVPERRQQLLNDRRYRGAGATRGGGGMFGGGFDDYGRGATKGGGNWGAGMTGMTGHSSQTFGQARHIIEDESRAVTITLRLVIDKDAVPGSPRPLPGRMMSNPVPPPVE